VEPLSRSDPSRPMSPRPVAERARDWLEWFGTGRLVAATLATVVVCLGGFWLVRSPPPPTEASLPQASTTGDAIASTVPATSTTSSVMLVHVAGAVVSPGVYELSPGARVRDAIMAAGGPNVAADWNALNLAALVADASRVYVPVVGEQVPAEPTDGRAGAESLGPIDVNRATAEELDALPGVGPATAAAIVAERERNGPFAGVDDLDRVPGIGPAKLAALRDLVTA
jgi:competence protein ComEA